MELNLQPLAPACFVSGDVFQEGDRVMSCLVRSATLEIMRYDMLEAQSGEFAPDGSIICSWVHPYKAKPKDENMDRALKLTAENLFVTLADPLNESTAENTRLIQFLALMLERKRILKPKGRSADSSRNLYEHARSKMLFEVPVGDITPEFFLAVQDQLSVLVGPSKTTEAETVAEPVTS